MSAALRKHGEEWARFYLREGVFGKTVTLVMVRDGVAKDLLEFTAVGDQLLYCTAGNQPVLGDRKDTEHATNKAPGEI